MRFGYVVAILASTADRRPSIVDRRTPS